MTLTSPTATEQFVTVAGLQVEVLKGGSGDPLVILHRDVGNPGWLPFHEELASSRTVYIPSHSGFGKSERPEWARNVRDIAALQVSTLQELGLGPVDLCGFGFGGWIAAEIAIMNPSLVRKLVLVGAAGIQPKEGEIMDQFIMSTRDYVKAMFHDETKFNQVYGSEPDIDQLEIWEIDREMTTRVAWKPYMFNHAIQHLMSGVKAPTLLVWGKQDKVVPPICGEQYRDATPNARLEVIGNCGHFAEVDQASAMAKLIGEFLAE
jgi:pimeloyl-ACP methyl ester carboxylesterase